MKLEFESKYSPGQKLYRVIFPYSLVQTRCIEYTVTSLLLTFNKSLAVSYILYGISIDPFSLYGTNEQIREGDIDPDISIFLSNPYTESAFDTPVYFTNKAMAEYLSTMTFKEYTKLQSDKMALEKLYIKRRLEQIATAEKELDKQKNI